MTIDSFKGKYGFLSNFWPAATMYDGMLYSSTEHAYQAAKTQDIHAQELIQNVPTAKEAKAIGRQIELRPMRDKIKFDIMYALVFEKFHSNKRLKQLLLDTGDEELIEGNNWGDVYWGVYKGIGENNLGKILMRVRNEIKDDYL